MIGKSTLLVIFITAINAALGFVVAPSRGMAQKGCSVGIGFPLSARALEQEESVATISGPPSSSSPLPRRQVLQVALSAVFFGASALPAAAVAAAADEKTVYLTGKAPKVPGQKPKDKSDVSGTRKDPKFLRSLSDCKSRCETIPTSEGLARSKEDCLSECQDICCASYEQCTFGIVPRI
jgi:hypothetical protein